MNDEEPSVLGGMTSQPQLGMTIQLTPHVWAMVTHVFPWAREEPEEAAVFLLGFALGGWLERERNETGAEHASARHPER